MRVHEQYRIGYTKVNIEGFSREILNCNYRPKTGIDGVFTRKLIIFLRRRTIASCGIKNINKE